MPKSYKPYHIIIFVVACLILLGVVVQLVPSGRKDILGYEFRFLSQNKLLKLKQRHEVNISDVIADVDTTMIEIEEEEIIENDSIKEKRKNYHINESDLLSYDDSGKQNLIAFFKKLKNISDGKMRILHYGDSQIEGDRMTAFIRQRLQSQFGGSGPGFIPAINVYNTITFVQEYSPNFQRFTNFGGKSLNTNRYGILNSVGRFTAEIPDSISRDSLEMQTGWISIEPGRMAYSRAKYYNSIDLHYADAKDKCILRIYKNEELVKTDSLKNDGKYHVYSYNTANDPQNIRFEFESKVSPNILGFSLDGTHGVQVDNIAMRGSSGTFFGKIDQNLAKRIYENQKVELFIMQFGGNSMPYVKDSIGSDRAVSYFKGQLQTIKRLKPDAAIIVIGPSDMSTLIEGEYMTYPMLPYYVESMKKATKEIGGAYFDTYAAMGGEDSMVAWVESGLAGTDYIHFTNKGSSIAAQKFYDALMTVYNRLMKE